MILSFAACTSSYQSIYIETAHPSDAILSDEIKSLTLLNRSISDDFKNYDADSLQKYFYQKEFAVSSIILDSMAADTTLKVLGELLYESGRYDVVIPKDYSIYRGLKFYKLPNNLKWNFVRNTCELYNTDALLVIERFYNKISTSYKVSSLFSMDDYIHEASIDSKYDAIVKIYDPRKEEITKQLVLSDTIYWYRDDTSQRKLFSRLPKIKECLVQTSIQLALDIDNRISPRWETESRGFFSLKNKKDTTISSYINTGNWDSAYQYWFDLSTMENKSTRSKVEFNLALASEMQGDVYRAIEWANKSYQSQYRVQTENYLKKLGKRKKSLDKFKKLNSSSKKK